jgi:class 3 adenylate cyclase
VATEGDAFFAVFPTAAGTARAAVNAQRALSNRPWPEGNSLRVRMGIHTGEGVMGDDNYIGLDLHRTARINAAGHGGQVAGLGRNPGSPRGRSRTASGSVMLAVTG